MLRIAQLIRWQLLGFACYLGYLWLLPHSFGFDFERDPTWKLSRMAACLLAWLLICVLSVRQGRAWRWRYVLIGAALPLLVGVISAVSLPLMILDHWTRLSSSQHGSHWNEWLRAAGFAGSALTYAWLCATLCIRSRRWWTALGLGVTGFGLMLVLDFVLIAWATGPHRLH